MNHEVQLSEFQRGNLLTLARGLLTVRDTAFDMDCYSADHLEAYQEHPCGSVGCAVGYGPRLGIKSLGGEWWESYCDRVFTDDYDAWLWLFSSDWSRRDNSPRGAALRIIYMLRHGIPDDSDAQRFGHAPLYYLNENIEDHAPVTLPHSEPADVPQAQAVAQ